MTQPPHDPTNESPDRPTAQRLPWPGLSAAAAVLLVLALAAAGYSIAVTVPDSVGYARLAAFVFGLLPAAALWLASLGLWLGGRAVAQQRGGPPPRAVPVLVWAAFLAIVLASLLFEYVPSDPP